MTEDGRPADAADDGADGAEQPLAANGADQPLTVDGPEQPLAAVVAKVDSEVAIASLRAEDVYDDARRVREYAADPDDRLALPVTEPPTDTSVLEVVRQVDPDYRPRDLETLLAERGWSDDELARAPGSWSVVGRVILVELPPDCPDDADVADALLDLHGGAATVLADEGISGTYRKPSTRHLAGETDTETVHVEHGTRYALDPARVMFSVGNQAERVRMGEVVSDGERVFDMFAGIGYFTLPMARAGARVTATELNPTAFQYLLENAVANDVTERVDAYLTDCRELADELAVDRVVMGYYGEADGTDDEGESQRTGEAHSFLPAALAALEPGGTVHYHEATPEALFPERPYDRLESAVREAGRRVNSREYRRVKSHSAGVGHVVVDAKIE